MSWCGVSARCLARGRFKPLGDEALAQVDIHLPEFPLTAIDEFVGCICWDNDDLPCPRFERRCANHIRSRALLENKDLLIRMLMQPHPPLRAACQPE